jgi:hypothetical protein
MSGQSPLGMMQASQRMGRGGGAAPRSGRRRMWTIVAAAAVIVLGAGWCGLWYYAASVADRTLAGWVAREAQAGRTYRCGSQGISGFPFRIQVQCEEAAATINSTRPPFDLSAHSMTFSAQVYNPTLLVGEVTGPLTVASPGQPPRFVASWSLAQLRVSGTPPAPDTVAIDLERPHLDGGAAANAPTLFAADDADLQARIVSGSATDHPVIDVVLHFTSATAPTVHPLLGEPLKGDAEVVLRGLKDLTPKPFAERFRELQASDGNIEIKSLRLERTDAIVVGTGTLTVDARGELDGTLTLTVNGLDTIVPQLGIDKLIDQGINRLSGANGQSGEGLSALDRLLPGLSGVVRNGATAGVIDNLKRMGQPTQIDNKPAVALPLRFADGAVYLGIIRIGEVPPLF